MQHKKVSAMKMILTVDDLADAFGGTGKFAEWADVGPSTVSNWRALARIPSSYHLRIYVEAHERGWKLSPTLFGFEHWPRGMDGKSRPTKAATAA